MCLTLINIFIDEEMEQDYDILIIFFHLKVIIEPNSEEGR